MGWNNSVFQLLIVSAGSPFSGLFVYSPAPGTGNLIAQITGVAGTDPYGNAVAPVANFGHWSGAGALLRHFGIDANGNTYLANTSGLTVVFENSSDGSIQFYNTSGQALGNLTSSIAPATGTDPAGNTYQNGITTYNGANFLQMQQTSLTFHNTANATDPLIQNSGSSLNLNSGTTAGSPTTGGIEIDAGTAGGNAPRVILNASTLLELPTVTTPTQPLAGNTDLFSDANGFARMLPGLAGDTNTYQIGEIVLTNGGFTINSTTPQTIMSCPVGIGTYVTEVWLVVANSTAADGAGFAFSGPAAGVQLVDFESKTTGTATVGYGASATYTTQFSNQGVAGNQGVLIRMLAAFSASGTLAITGKQLVALNNVTVFGGWMRVRHVS